MLHDPAAATYAAVMQGVIPADTVPPPVLAAGVSGLADAFGYTFTVAAVLILLCLVPALLSPRKPIAATAGDDQHALLPTH